MCGTRVEVLSREVAVPYSTTHNSQEEEMKKIVAIGVLLALIAGLTFAQTATPKVTKRQARQQERIYQGAKSGELTNKEFKNLEKQEGKIAADKAKAKEDGVVTKQERKRLHREQNAVSRHIYRQKHDAQKAK
jgi:uncharacterized protein HemX